MALDVLQICKEEKRNGELFLPVSQYLARASMLTGVSKRTLTRLRAASILEERAKRKERADKIVVDDFDRCVIRRTIHNMLILKTTVPSVNSILKQIKSPDSIRFKGGREILRRILKEMGFVWRKSTDNRKFLMERSDIVAQRINFLRQMKKYREEGREIVYTDESYVNAGHAVTRCWQTDSISLTAPISKGERMIIVHAGTMKGFISGAKLVYKAGSSTGDYHHEMNFENFSKWLAEKLIPNLKPKSVLVLDNASYHNVQQDKFPTMASRKVVIQEWLQSKNIAFTPSMLKAELLELCKKNKTAPIYMVDEMLRKHGHSAIRLPPYHADLNAIELVWGDLKGYIARNNLTFKFSDLEQLIDEAFEQVTAEKWANCCAHVESVEKKYWQNDIAVEKEIERIVIDVNSDESDVNTSDNDDETYDEDSVSDTDINSMSCSLDETLTANETSPAGQLFFSDETATDEELLYPDETTSDDELIFSEENATDDSLIFSDENFTNDEIIFLEESITDDEIKSTDETLTDDEILFTDDTQTADETLSADTLSADEMC